MSTSTTTATTTATTKLTKQDILKAAKKYKQENEFMKTQNEDLKLKNFEMEQRVQDKDQQTLDMQDEIENLQMDNSAMLDMSHISVKEGGDSPGKHKYLAQIADLEQELESKNYEVTQLQELNDQ